MLIMSAPSFFATSDSCLNVNHSCVGLLCFSNDQVEMLINGDPVDAMSFLTHESKAQPSGKSICKLLQKALPA